MSSGSVARGRQTGGAQERSARAPRRCFGARWLLACLFAVVLVACGQSPEFVDLPEPTPPPDGAPITLATGEGTEVAAYLWERDRDRIVIYLHGYLGDQRDWWPLLEVAAPGDASALTLDLHGHGDTDGDRDNQHAMVEEAQTAIAFARDRGSSEIVLAGAGMGAAIAMLAAESDPGVFVIALSVPVEFGEIEVNDAARALRDRLALIAAAGDVSAADSLDALVERAGLPSDRWLVAEGRTHGVDMLAAPRAEPRRFFAEMLEVAWEARAVDAR